MKSIIALALLLVLATTVFSRRIGGLGGYQTARYPSDSDVYGKAIPFLAEDEEDEESDIFYATKRYPSDSDNVISTRAYPSDSDFSFDDEEDDEEADLSLLYTTMRYPSDNGNTNVQTKKYPSDSDFATTMMYPSDGDFNRVALAADDEDEEEADLSLTEVFKKFRHQQYVTKAYPSDSDLGQTRKPVFVADEEDDDEESDVVFFDRKNSPFFTTSAYPSDTDRMRNIMGGFDDQDEDEEADLSPIFNSKPVSRAYPSDWDIGMQTKKYPSDSDTKKFVALEDDEESDFFDKLKLGKLPRSVSMAYPSDTDPMYKNFKGFNVVDEAEEDDDDEEADLSPIFTTKKYPSDYDNTLQFTKKYPSDSDAATTMKYPSDSDAQKFAFDDEEDEEESDILKYVTKAYPSDGDMNNRRFFAFAKDAAEEEDDDDEEADLSPIFTTKKYPSDYDNTLQFTKAYPSDTDIGLQTMKYPSDSDAKKFALDDEEDSE